MLRRLGVNDEPLLFVCWLLFSQAVKRLRQRESRYIRGLVLAVARRAGSRARLVQAARWNQYYQIPTCHQAPQRILHHHYAILDGIIKLPSDTNEPLYRADVARHATASKSSHTANPSIPQAACSSNKLCSACTRILPRVMFSKTQYK